MLTRGLLVGLCMVDRQVLKGLKFEVANVSDVHGTGSILKTLDKEEMIRRRRRRKDGKQVLVHGGNVRLLILKLRLICPDVSQPSS